MTASKQLDQNFKKILQSIETYKKKYSNTSREVTLIAVSKKKPVSDILELLKLGQKDFAENYLNEALAKIIQIKNINKENNNIVWHFIGRIQSNKTRPIAENFSWVHSIDKLKIAQRLNNQRPDFLEKLNLLIQVNIDNDANKAGVHTDEVLNLASEISKLPNIRLRGLMCILQLEQSLEPSSNDLFDAQYKSFSKLHKIYSDLNTKHGLCLDTLSMGMSSDYEAAIAAGSTMVRIGSSLFGARE